MEPLLILYKQEHGEPRATSPRPPAQPETRLQESKLQKTIFTARFCITMGGTEPQLHNRFRSIVFLPFLNCHLAHALGVSVMPALVAMRTKENSHVYWLSLFL